MIRLTAIRSQPILSPSLTWVPLSALMVLAFHMYARRRKLLVSLPGPPGGKWITGHFKSIVGINGSRFQDELLSTYGPTMKLNGAFGEEIIFTADPACMHSVLIKERAKFERPHGTTLLIRSVFGGGLLGLTGDEHRAHRKLLNPVFTTKFLRELMPIFLDVARHTSQGIRNDLANGKGSDGEVDIFSWATAAALELVGEAGLGYSFNSFTGERSEYNIAIKSVVPAFAKLLPFTSLLPYVYRIGTPAFRRWALQFIPSPMIQRLRDAVNIQNRQAEEVLQARHTLLSSGADLSSEAGRGRDIMTLLMKANEAEGSEFHIDRQEMVGHMNVFIFAGHETTSSAISRILQVLANHQSVQDKLREEIGRYFSEHPDDSHHDGLLELPYLDAVVRETLRLFEPASLLGRTCLEDTILPLEYPVETPSGTLTSIPVKKGTRVILSVTMANHYEKVWGEQARKFLPERWVGSRLEEVTQPGAQLPGVYSSMMTFGAGSRACIGFTFAIMEIKVTIARLIQDFKFEPSQEEVVWETLGVQVPFLTKDLSRSTRFPKLPLKVAQI